MADSIKVIIEAILKDEKFRKGLKGMKAGLGTTGQKSTGILEKMRGNFLAVTAAIGGAVFAFKKMIGIATQFEQTIANVAAVVGGSKKELAALAREAAVNTVFSAKEAGEALFFLASAGLKVKDMAEVLAPTLNLAAAGGLEIAEATDLVVNNLKVFGLEMSETANITDIMAQANSSANTDIRQLGEALKAGAPIAKAVGVKFKDLTAIIAAMANRGIKGSRAGIQLRQAFARLAKPTDAAKRSLAGYGITIEDVNRLLPTPIKLFELFKERGLSLADGLEILGVRQSGLIGLIQDGIPDLKNMSAAMDEAGGKAEEMALIQVDTLTGALKLLRNAFQEIILSGSDGLLPVFKAIIKTLIGVFRVFGKLPKAMKTIIGAVVTLTPLIIGLGFAIKALGISMAVFSAVNPIILGIAAAAAAIITVIALIKRGKKEADDLNKKLAEPAAIAIRKKLIDQQKEGIELTKKRRKELEKTLNTIKKEAALFNQGRLKFEKLNEATQEYVKNIGKGFDTTKGLVEEIVELDAGIARATEKIARLSEELQKVQAPEEEGEETPTQKRTAIDKVTIEEYMEFLGQQRELELLAEEEKYAQILAFAEKNDLDLISLEIKHNENIKKINDKFRTAEEKAWKKFEITRKQFADQFTISFLSGIDSMKSSSKDILKAMIKDFANMIAGRLRALAAFYLASANFPAAGVALAQAGLVKGIGGSVAASFQEGTQNVPTTGFANIHKGERIIPANQNISGVSNEEFTRAAIAGLQMPDFAGGSNMSNNTTNNNAGDSINNTFNLPGENSSLIERLQEIEEDLNVKIFKRGQ